MDAAAWSQIVLMDLMDTQSYDTGKSAMGKRSLEISAKVGYSMGFRPIETGPSVGVKNICKFPGTYKLPITQPSYCLSRGRAGPHPVIYE